MAAGGMYYLRNLAPDILECWLTIWETPVLTASVMPSGWGQIVSQGVTALERESGLLGMISGLRGSGARLDDVTTLLRRVPDVLTPMSVLPRWEWVDGQGVVWWESDRLWYLQEGRCHVSVIGNLRPELDLSLRGYVVLGLSCIYYDAASEPPPSTVPPQGGDTLYAPWLPPLDGIAPIVPIVPLASSGLRDMHIYSDFVTGGPSWRYYRKQVRVDGFDWYSGPVVETDMRLVSSNVIEVEQAADGTDLHFILVDDAPVISASWPLALAGSPIQCRVDYTGERDDYISVKSYPPIQFTRPRRRRPVPVERKPPPGIIVGGGILAAVKPSGSVVSIVDKLLTINGALLRVRV